MGHKGHEGGDGDDSIVVIFSGGVEKGKKSRPIGLDYRERKRKKDLESRDNTIFYCPAPL